MARTPKVLEDRREQIISAAMRVFAEKGFTRATNRDIAKEAGITAGLIYYYFENKEALLRSVLETRSPIQIVEQISAETLDQPPEVFLPMLLTRVMGFVEGEQFIALIRVILPEVIYNPQLAPLVMSFIQRALDFLGNYLQIQIVRGVIRDDLNPALLNQIILGSVMGFILRRGIFRDPAAFHFTHQEMVQTLVDAFLNGVRVR